MAATKAAPKKRSQFEEVWRRLKKNKMAMIGLALVIFLILLAVCADFLFDYEEVVIKQNTAIRLQGPSAEHWFGTDEFGRDILARLVHGGRISLVVGVIAVGIALTIGGTLGAISGFFGGTVDMVISRLMDVLLAVPSLLLSITIVSALGPSIINLMIAIAVSSVPLAAVQNVVQNGSGESTENVACTEMNPGGFGVGLFLNSLQVILGQLIALSLPFLGVKGIAQNFSKLHLCVTPLFVIRRNAQALATVTLPSSLSSISQTPSMYIMPRARSYRP